MNDDQEPIDMRITEAIREVVADGTFTEAALEQMKTALNEVEKLESTVSNLDYKNKVLDRDLHNAYSENRTQAKKLQDHDARNDELKAREAVVHKAEIGQAADKARAETWRAACELMFRNTQVRREFMASDNRQEIDPHGGTQYLTNNKSETETTQEE